MSMDPIGFRAFLELISHGIIIASDNGEVLYQNDSAHQLLGIDHLDLLEKGVAAFTGKPELNKVWEALRNHGHGKQSLTVREGKKELSVTVSRLDSGLFDKPSTVFQISDLAELRQLENLKNGLTDKIVHRMKGPLTSINTSLALLASPVYLEMPPDVREIVSLGYSEVKRLRVVLDEMTDLIALETGVAESNLYFEKINLKNLLESMLVAFKENNSGAAIDWRWERTEIDKIEIIGDYERLRQILATITGLVAGAPPRDTVMVLSARVLGDEKVELSMTAERIAMSGPEKTGLVKGKIPIQIQDPISTEEPGTAPYPADEYLELMGGTLILSRGKGIEPTATFCLRGGLPEY